MKIINPAFTIQNPEWNIFTIRKRDYENILPVAREILKAPEDLGFTLEELELRDIRFSSGELSKTLKQNLVIKLKKGNSLIDLSIYVPKLIDDNYVFINGRRKIPLFQLYDIPLVTRGDNIKLRTNVATLILSVDKESPRLKCNFLGRKVPFSLILLSYYSLDEITNLIDLANKNYENKFHHNLITDLNDYIEESKGYTQDDFSHELGRYYSKYNAKSKGYDVLYALDLIPKVDIFTKEFLDNPQQQVLPELLRAIQIENIDDTEYTNKRVRCFEYVIFAKISKMVFDLCLANRTTKQPKFNINSSQILSECNVSDIVQFDFSINPIEELTKLSRISLLGPGGFKRENIPRHLRDITKSMFGRICPVDTPDRDNCGVLQNLIPNVKLDDNLRFSEEICDKQPISIPVSMTPFCKNDDQTRLQMASSQMRQSIMLKNFDTPLISSGCEGLYTDQTQFVKIAKKDGEVIHVDKNYILVMYKDGEPDIFDVRYRKIYVENVDFMNPYIDKIGMKFKAGDIIAESNFCKEGSVTFGKNLLTGVMVYYGHNYEDGIVISDRLSQDDVLTSVHYTEMAFNITPDKVLLSLDDDSYKPLPKELESLKAGDPYAILKKLTIDDFYSVFQEQKVMEVKKDMFITEINLYGNAWNEEVPEYKEWIESKIQEQVDEEKLTQKVIKEYFDKKVAQSFIREKNLDKFSFTNKYKIKKEKIQGMRIELFGLYLRKINVGDKIGNRHGNKGVISAIVPHEKMPQLEDGRHLDICINPLGIISRMNMGQLFEYHLSMSVNDLKINILDMIEHDISDKDIRKYILDYIKIVDKTKDGWYYEQFEQQLPEKITVEFVKDFTIIQPPFESCKREEIEEAMAYTNTPYTQKVFDPVSKETIHNEITCGFGYFFRMVHIAEEKLAARGIGAYARRTLQPLGGRKNKGGQRCGEMETACLIGHDASCNLFEFLTTKSDCISLKNNYIRNYIEKDLIEDNLELDAVPESVKLLNSYLTVLGVNQK
ncbi:MAG: DNA-directed RNA polymerase subunit beta [Candidatus Heimdallarchaeaceae archaeon]